MEQVTIRHTELLTMDPETKAEFKKIAATYKYKVDLLKKMKEVGEEISRPTLKKLLKGKGNSISIEKAKRFIEKVAA